MAGMERAARLGWKPIGSAPTDGTMVEAAADILDGYPVYPLGARYLDGRWTTTFSGEWRPYDPQPLYWRDPQAQG